MTDETKAFAATGIAVRRGDTIALNAWANAVTGLIATLSIACALIRMLETMRFSPSTMPPANSIDAKNMTPA